LSGDAGADLIRDMKRNLSRRAVLGALLAGAAGPALASAPVSSTRPPLRGAKPLPPQAALVDNLVQKAGLGGHVSFVVADLRTGAILEAREPARLQPPASVAKAVTAAYALDTLGPEHRFVTELIAAGPVVDGRIKGDLVLSGGGDPALDSDGLAVLIEAMKAAGIRGVDGTFRIWSGGLPALPWIDGAQPDHVGYNPAISGLNLNYNRVHFEWKKGNAGWETSMEARAERFSPRVEIARMSIADSQPSVYSYTHRDGVDRWSVARRALGNGGSRWLPVRRPDAYAQEVFLIVARSFGFDLRAGAPMSAPPQGTIIVQERSAALQPMLRSMLRYSTNLTAEVTGLTASAARGPIPGSLGESAARMDAWAKDRLGAFRPALTDHSGLGYDSAISATDMVKILVAANREEMLRPILREFAVSDDKGASVPPDRLAVVAKTGTLNFVSALAGYARTGEGRDLAFAIFTGDVERRDAIPVEARERPEGAQSWAGRSRRLQQDLLVRWSNVYSA
jgi:D-alanyl-D-alanine carboxypeptidase/D-alanyl-D-alanine-endopeptidase (penicillin-binding protein 4)